MLTYEPKQLFKVLLLAHFWNKFVLLIMHNNESKNFLLHVHMYVLIDSRSVFSYSLVYIL